jgi:hypothetical protein
VSNAKRKNNREEGERVNVREPLRFERKKEDNT